VIFIRHAVFHIIRETETAVISIILGLYSVEHTKVVLGDRTRKSRIIQTSAVPVSLILGNAGWQMRITQDVKYLGALALFFETAMFFSYF
jgi:hypothetical protein